MDVNSDNNQNNKDYLDEYIYDYIDEQKTSSDKYKRLSGNLKDRLSELFDSIEDEECDEILCDIDEINIYLTKLNDYSNKEFTLIKNYAKILLEKYYKHKEKIKSLKIKNKMVQEELAEKIKENEKLSEDIDKLDYDYYKLKKENENMLLNISIKENEENQRQKINNEILSDKKKELEEKIENLNKQIKLYEEKINNLTLKNKELYENNSKIIRDLFCKDEIIKASMEKYQKLNDEKESIRISNKELKNQIEKLNNQIKDYEMVIKCSEEEISELKAKLNSSKKLFFQRGLNLGQLIEENEEQDNDNNRNSINANKNEMEIEENDKEEIDEVDSTDQGINLKDLIFDHNESSENENENKNENEKKIEMRNQIRLAFTRVKHARRFTKLQSYHHQIKKFRMFGNLKTGKNKELEGNHILLRNHLSQKSVLLYTEKISEEISENESYYNFNRNKSKSKSSILNNDKTNSIGYDEIFLYELLYRFLEI